MDPAASQLCAAVLALINTLIARTGHPSDLLRFIQRFSFARWGLEGYVISESNRLTGDWQGQEPLQMACCMCRSSREGAVRVRFVEQNPSKHHVGTCMPVSPRRRL